MSRAMLEGIFIGIMIGTVIGVTIHETVTRYFERARYFRSDQLETVIREAMGGENVREEACESKQEIV